MQPSKSKFCLLLETMPDSPLIYDGITLSGEKNSLFEGCPRLNILICMLFGQPTRKAISVPFGDHAGELPTDIRSSFSPSIVAV